MTTNAICAMGLDTGMTHTGVAVVTDQDTVLHAAVLTPPAYREVIDKLRWLYWALREVLNQYEPLVIGIEVYTAPSPRVRATSARQVAEHNWLIGACTALGSGRLCPPGVLLLEATEWMHQLSGIPARLPIGNGVKATKDVIAQCVTQRTGYIFQHNSGGHRSDACGIALVALDNVRMLEHTRQGGVA
jgi:Holliday junction resolvasome RuvABC endonuclease subunit